MDDGRKGVGFTPPSGTAAGGSRSAGLEARIEARVAAVAGAAAEAIQEFEERVIGTDERPRSGSPDRGADVSTTEAEPTMGAVVRERTGAERHPLARQAAAETAGAGAKAGSMEERMWCRRLSPAGDGRLTIAAFRSEHFKFYGTLTTW